MNNKKQFCKLAPLACAFFCCASLSLHAQDSYDVSLRIVDADGENPGYEAIVRLNGKTLQVLEARVEDRPGVMEKFGNVIQKDVNFDGLDDLLIKELILTDYRDTHDTYRLLAPVINGNMDESKFSL